MATQATTGPFVSLRYREWANRVLSYANELGGEHGTVDQTFLCNRGVVVLVKRAWDSSEDIDKFLIVAGTADGELTINGMASELAANERFELAVKELA